MQLSLFTIHLHLHLYLSPVILCAPTFFYFSLIYVSDSKVAIKLGQAIGKRNLKVCFALSGQEEKDGRTCFQWAYIWRTHNWQAPWRRSQILPLSHSNCRSRQKKSSPIVSVVLVYRPTIDWQPYLLPRSSPVLSSPLPQPNRAPGHLYVEVNVKSFNTNNMIFHVLNYGN